MVGTPADVGDPRLSPPGDSPGQSSSTLPLIALRVHARLRTVAWIPDRSLRSDLLDGGRGDPQTIPATQSRTCVGGAGYHGISTIRTVQVSSPRPASISPTAPLIS